LLAKKFQGQVDRKGGEEKQCPGRGKGQSKKRLNYLHGLTNTKHQKWCQGGEEIERRKKNGREIPSFLGGWDYPFERV